jgi:probable H4MPT-linked C1 transfer pathway protein
MIFGVDIGGVNMKITQLTQEDARLKARSTYFPFSGKDDMIEKLVLSVKSPDLVVITQTFCANRGLFASAKEGTCYLIDITEKLFKNVKYMGLPCTLYSSKEAKENYLQVAGRNWVGTCYVATYLNLVENGLVIDCGTNSVDIVPVIDSQPVTIEGDCDKEYTRLKTGELVWSGLYFTPIPSISNTVVIDGEEFHIKSTTRAMSLDIYIVLGLVSPEQLAAKYQSYQKEIGYVSFESAVGRMYDVLSSDKELLTVDDAKKIAQFLSDRQIDDIGKAVNKVLSAVKEKFGYTMKTVAVAGAGKDIILKKALETTSVEEVVDIEKAAFNAFDMGDSHNNCETSLGCVLMGMKFYDNKSDFQ